MRGSVRVHHLHRQTKLPLGTKRGSRVREKHALAVATSKKKAFKDREYWLLALNLALQIMSSFVRGHQKCVGKRSKILISDFFEDYAILRTTAQACKNMNSIHPSQNVMVLQRQLFQQFKLGLSLAFCQIAIRHYGYVTIDQSRRVDRNLENEQIASLISPSSRSEL